MAKSLSIPPTQVSFENRQIRRKWHGDEWWFSVADVIDALIDSKNPSVYWRVLKKRLLDEGAGETVTNCNGLKMPAADGKVRLIDCANTETMLRLIQSIPSPKAEPFKLWLSRVGYDRIKEIENPELAAERAHELYKAKGYSDNWIEKRLSGVAVNEKLLDGWKKRGVKETKEYAILTAEISQATFGMKEEAYKKFKSIGKQQELRDHMNDLELIFTMLGEAATSEIAEADNAQGFEKNRIIAIQGGKLAGKARKELEVRTGRKVISKTGARLTEKQQKNIGKGS